MLFMPTAWTLSTGLPMEAGIPRLWDTSVSIISETSQDCQLGWADGVLPLPAARTYKEGLPPKTGILGFWDGAVPISIRTREDTVYSSTP